MDEVDAFLDTENVDEIANFLQKKLNHYSQAAHCPTQVLVVSHKDDFSSQMDSLVGVCMLNHINSSLAHTVNLRECDEIQ